MDHGHQDKPAGSSHTSSQGSTPGGVPAASDRSDREVGIKGEAGPRERILQASLELFVKQGYFNTNVPDISKLSRCSVGSIYHHFLNKEEIAEQLYKDGIQQFREALTGGLSALQNGPAGRSVLENTVRATVVAFLKFAEEHHLLARYLWLARHSEFLSKKVVKPTVVGFDSLGRQLTKVIKQGVRDGEIKDRSAEIIWSIIFGIPLSFLTDWLDGYTRSTPSEVADVLADSCWSALRGV